MIFFRKKKMSRETVNRKREIQNTTGNLHKKCPAFRSFFFIRIQSNCGIIRIRKTPNIGIFQGGLI